VGNNHREQIEPTLTTLHEALPHAPMPEPQRGDRIGRYVVETVLGTGGMGVVVSAHDPGLARQVAVKLVRRDVGDRAYRLRLVREARTMARLEHDNVVRVYDAGEHDGEVFVAMELVRGETIGHWLRAGPRPWREVLARFVAAGRGLAAAHREGLVHRDFKPDNVLVRASDGRVCVTDFGLAVPASLGAAHVDTARVDAAILDTLPVAGRDDGGSDTAEAASEAGTGPARPAHVALTRTGAVVGTPAYMAPEQHRGGNVDARSDVFSFCVALYEGLYGERPFAALSDRPPDEPLLRVVRPPPPGRRVPAAVRRAVLRGLAPEPSNRWRDMDALLAALAGAQRPRRRWALGVVAIAVAVGVLALVLARRPDGVVAPAEYDEAVQKLRRDDFHGAIAALEGVTRRDPDFVPAWLALARARIVEPDPVRARAALDAALRRIPPQDIARRLEAEGLGAELDENWDVAIDRYQTYARLVPGDVEVGLALADAQIYGGHPSDALVTVRSLGAVSGDVRLALAEAKAANALSDWARVIAAADRAIAVGQATAAPGILARAYLRRALARSKLKRAEAARSDLALAGIAARQAHDRPLEARQLTTETVMLHEIGDPAGAARAAEQAVVIDREIGEPHNLAADLLNAAAAYGEVGRPDRAGPLYREAFQVLRPLYDPLLLAVGLRGYGQMLNDLGDRKAADPPLREALGLARAGHDDNLAVHLLGDIALNDFGLGLVKQAEAEWRDSATLAQRLGETVAVAAAYENISEVLSVQGDHAGALRSIEQAVRLAEQIDPNTLAAERAWYAVDLIAAGQPARAVEVALTAIDPLHDHQLERDELTARAAAACALALVGRREEARAQLALGRALLARPLPVDYRARAAILLARAADRLGSRDMARDIVSSIPRDRVAIPWAEQLAALAGRLSH
jgi:tetratricopeptide (TPR) repeat protein/predicted Ser/Thr protein kinase